MKRGSSSSRFNWLTETGCISRRFYFRHDEAEFPPAPQNACNSRGSRAADCASSDALRSLNNWEIIEDKHELVSTGETPAPWARPVSTSGRPRPLSRATRAGTESKNILAARRGIFWRQRQQPAKDGHAITQRPGATTTSTARTAATAAAAQT